MLHANAENKVVVLLNEDEVARRLNLSVRTLQAWRIRGVGPAFVRCGRAIRYQPSAVEKWMDARTVMAEQAS